MDKALFQLKKTHCGPGGYTCECCNPAFGHFKGPGSRKNRQASKRALRRVERQQYRRAGDEEIHRQILESIEEHNQIVFDFSVGTPLTYTRGIGVRALPVPEIKPLFQPYVEPGAYTDEDEDYFEDYFDAIF